MPAIIFDITSGARRVTSTGSTVTVYDAQGTQLARFRDLTHAYKGAISPRGDLLAVKSNEGKAAVYDLGSLTLAGKFRYGTANAAHDGGFCFSPDGSRLLIIEKWRDDLHTALSVWRMDDLSLEHRWFTDLDLTFLLAIEYDEAADRFYVIGFERNAASRVASTWFAARLGDSVLEDVRPVPQHVCEFYHVAAESRNSGYLTAPNVVNSWVNTWAATLTKPICLQLMAQLRQPHSLAELWRGYDPQLETPGVPGLELPTPEQVRGSMMQRIEQDMPPDDPFRRPFESI